MVSYMITFICFSFGLRPPNLSKAFILHSWLTLLLALNEGQLTVQLTENAPTTARRHATVVHEGALKIKSKYENAKCSVCQPNY